MKKSLLLLFLICLLLKTKAQYSTPNTGTVYTLDDLVNVSGGALINSGGFYSFNADITISVNDRLDILNNATVKFAANTALNVFGNINIAPPDTVFFTAQNPAVSFNGVKLDGCTASSVNRFVFEYAVSFKVNNCKPLISNSIFRFNNNNSSTTFGNGAISLFFGSPLITNCSFISNQRAAIQGGASIANAPQIINCLFRGNNTTNQNLPQINLGTTGADTVKIIGNQIRKASANSGGIGFLPLGNVQALILNNVIDSNRYGITFNGGANIYSLTGYNQITENNTAGNPNTGGSGIAFLGGSATSHQNSIVTGNYFKGNLWGVTIQGRSQPNLGNLSNADTSDNGKNIFVNNNNASGTQTELYNNSPDPINAQANYWNTNSSAEVEGKIFHQPDNAALGFVNYGPFLLPVRLLQFTALALKNDAELRWTTSQESNTSFFTIEKSDDGVQFSALAQIAAAGNSTTERNYFFTDAGAGFTKSKISYRIKITDADGRAEYSKINTIRFSGKGANIKVFPLIATQGSRVNAIINSPVDQTISIYVYDLTGKLIIQFAENINQGINTLVLNNLRNLKKGIWILQFEGEDLRQSIKYIVQ